MESQTLATRNPHETPRNGSILPADKAIKGEERDALAERIKKFLEVLYGPKPEKGYLVLWTKQDKRSRFYSLDQLDEAASEAAFLSEETDVYYGIGLSAGTHDFEINRVEAHHFSLYGFDASPDGTDCYNGTFNDCVAHTGRDAEANVDGFALRARFYTPKSYPQD